MDHPILGRLKPQNIIIRKVRVPKTTNLKPATTKKTENLTATLKTTKSTIGKTSQAPINPVQPVPVKRAPKNQVFRSKAPAPIIAPAALVDFTKRTGFMSLVEAEMLKKREDAADAERRRRERREANAFAVAKDAPKYIKKLVTPTSTAVQNPINFKKIGRDGMGLVDIDAEGRTVKERCSAKIQEFFRTENEMKHKLDIERARLEHEEKRKLWQAEKDEKEKRRAEGEAAKLGKIAGKSGGVKRKRDGDDDDEEKALKKGKGIA